MRSINHAPVPASISRLAAIAQLAERIASADTPEHDEAGQRWPRVPTGWVDQHATPEAQAAWGGLTRGQVHEFLAGQPPTHTHAPTHSPSPPHAPTAILTHLAWQGLRATLAEGTDAIVAWVGRALWPSGWALAAADPAGRTLLRRSLLIDAQTPAERAWAIDLAARQEGVAVVVGDGAGLDMASSRRLQLAAAARSRRTETSTGGPLVLLARPGNESGVLSAAATRWRITPITTRNGRPRWSVELIRRKGLRPIEDSRALIVELRRGTSLCVAVAAELECGTGLAELVAGASIGADHAARVA